MNKFVKLSLTAMASITFAGAAVMIDNSQPAVMTVQASSKENTDLANRDIANYLANCQQYESNDKQFKGFTSIKDIKYIGKSQIHIDVNNDFYQLSKPRRDLLIDNLQNGVIGTLMDNDLQKMAESDVRKGCQTSVYLNNKLIGQSSKSNYRHIIWKK